MSLWDILTRPKYAVPIKFFLTFRLLKTTYHKKHGADRICFTHHPHSVICSSIHNLDVHGGDSPWTNFWFWLHERIVYMLLCVCCQSLCDTYPCTIIDVFVTLRDIKRGRCFYLGIYLSNDWNNVCFLKKYGNRQWPTWFFLWVLTM